MRLNFNLNIRYYTLISKHTLLVAPA